MEQLNRWRDWHRDEAGGPGPNTAGPSTRPGAVVVAWAPRVYNLARRMLGSDADAESVAEEVLVQAIREFGALPLQAQPIRRLQRITANRVLLHRRMRAGGGAGQVGDFLPHSLNPPPFTTRRRRGQEGSLQAPPVEELPRLIEEAIGRLPEVYRDAYVLADVEGCAHADVGEMLELSIAAVKSRLHRARLLVRGALGFRPCVRARSQDRPSSRKGL